MTNDGSRDSDGVSGGRLSAALGVENEKKLHHSLNVVIQEVRRAASKDKAFLLPV